MPRQTGGISYTPQWNFVGTGDAISLQSYNSLDGTYSLILTEPLGDLRYQPLNAKLTAIAGLANAAGVLTNNGSGVFSYTSGGGVSSVSGTTNRITSTGGSTPVLDIAATYAGQTSITTLGTIGTGVWNGTSIADAYISSASTWNAKQAALSGTGFVKISGSTISYDNSTYYKSGDNVSLGTAAFNTGAANNLIINKTGTYNYLSLNNNINDGAGIGVIGGGTSDPSLYLQSGNSGNVVIRVGGSSTNTVVGQFTIDGLVTSGGSFSAPIVSTTAQALKITNDGGYISGFNSAGSTRSGYLQIGTTATTLATDGNNAVNLNANGSTVLQALSSGVNITGTGIVSSRFFAGVASPTQTAASVSATSGIQAYGDVFSGGPSAGIFWGDRVNTVTSNTNWYGWYSSGSTTNFWNGGANILSISNGGDLTLGGNLTGPTSYEIIAANDVQFKMGGAYTLALSPNTMSLDGQFLLNDNIVFAITGVGPIIRSPDGTAWRIAVDNSGVITAIS